MSQFSDEHTSQITRCEDHAQFYERGPYRQFLVERRLAGSLAMPAFVADQPAGNFPDPPFENALIYLCLRGVREASFDWGAGRWRGRWRSGDLTMVPTDSASNVTLSDRHAFMALCVPKSRIVDSPGTAIGNRVYARPFRDPLITELLRTIWQDASSEERTSRLFVDDALCLLLRRLSMIGDAPAPTGRSQPCFSAPAARRLVEFVDAHHARDLSVTDLAQVVNCRPSRFTEMFRNSFGTTPYRHVVSVRLGKARALLQGADDMAIAQIALVTGFCSQSHLTAAYGREFGETPHATRAAIRG